MLDQAIKEAGIKLMENSKAVYVTTIGVDGYPRTRAMFNLRNKQQFPNQADLFAKHDNDLMVLLSTNTSSKKLHQIKQNPKVTVYYCKPTAFHGLMLSGDVQVLDDSAIRHAVWNEGWERYYPSGPDDPDHTILCLYPKFGQGWYQSRRYEFELDGK
jgi:general stress protein 26